MARSVFFNMYVGYNRTGKSSIAKYYANLWRINNPHGIVTGYDPQYRFRHLINPEFRLKQGEKRGWWHARKIHTLRNALFVADDYRGLHRWNVTSDDFYALMEFRAEYGIDIIMVCHGPSAILEGLGMYISHYYIFYTMGKDEKWDNKIDIAEHCTRANDLIKEYVRYLRDEKKQDIIKNPGLCYNTDTYEHKFPHIIVERSTHNLIPQNIEQEWIEKNKHKFKIQF